MIDASLIRDEFIEGSAIAPDVFESAVEIVPDLEFDPITREVTGTPLYDELGWTFTRFGHFVKPTMVGALFKQETGETWQAKVYGKANNGKRSGKYYARKGIGDRPYLPPVPRRVREVLALRYGVEPPTPDESFYDWLLSNPQVPLILNEGVKKALSVLSAGDAAISLYGCLCGTTEQSGFRIPKSSTLTNLYRERQVYIALDAGDTSAKAQRAVNAGIRRLAKSILVSGGKPKVITWKPSRGKGIDDLLAHSPDPDAVWEQLKADALDYSQWLCKDEYSLRREPNLEINAPLLTRENCPLETISSKLIAIKSPHGTRKTQRVCDWSLLNLNRGVPVFGLVPLRSLEKELSHRLGIPARKERTGLDLALGLGMTLCGESLRPKHNGFDIDKWDCDELVLIVEESGQLLNHFLLSNGTDVGKHRPQIIEQLQLLGQQATKIVLLDADIDESSLRFYERLWNERAYTIVNNANPGQFKLLNSVHSSDWLAGLTKFIASGKIPYIFSCAQKPTSKFGTVAIEANFQRAFPDRMFVRVDSETLHDPNSEVYKNRDRLEEFLIETGAIPIVSPSVVTGVSFNKLSPDAVFAINSGTLAPNSFLQAIWRVRALCDRHVYCEKSSAERIGGGGHFPHQVKASSKNLSQCVQLFGLFDYLQNEGEAGDILFDTWCELASRINRTNSYLRETFLSLVRRQGHEVIEGEAMDKSSRRKVNQEWHNGRCRTAIAWASKANEEDDLTEKEAEKLLATELLSSSERSQLDKHKCVSRYGRVSEHLLLADRKGLFPRLQLLSFLLLDLEVVKRRDERLINQKLADNDGKGYRFDICRSVLSPKIQLLKKLGIDDLFFALLSTAEVRSDSDLIAEFANRVCLAKNLLADFFNITIRDVECNPQTGMQQVCPVRVVNQILNLIGYKLTRSHRVQIDGKRQWVYRFEFFGFDQLCYFLDDGSKLPVIDVKEIEELSWEIINHWQQTEERLASDEPSQEAA